jgi:hypothetical protein
VFFLVDFFGVEHGIVDDQITSWWKFSIFLDERFTAFLKQPVEIFVCIKRRFRFFAEQTDLDPSGCLPRSAVRSSALVAADAAKVLGDSCLSSWHQ